MHSPRRGSQYLLLFFAFLLSSNAQMAIPSENDANVLLQIQSSWEGIYLEGWNTSNRAQLCTTWEGVTCDSNGRVAGIEISKSAGKAFLSSAILQLDALQSFQLTFEFVLFGDIPSGLFQLPRIGYIRIFGQCRLSWPATVPQSLVSVYTEYTYIQLSVLAGVQLTGTIPEFNWASMRIFSIVDGGVECPLPEGLLTRMSSATDSAVPWSWCAQAQPHTMLNVLLLTFSAPVSPMILDYQNGRLEVDGTTFRFFARNNGGEINVQQFLSLSLSLFQSDSDMGSNFDTELLAPRRLSPNKLELPFVQRNRRAQVISGSILLAFGGEAGNIKIGRNVVKLEVEFTNHNVSAADRLNFASVTVSHLQHTQFGQPLPYCPDTAENKIFGFFYCKTPLANISATFIRLSMAIVCETQQVRMGAAFYPSFRRDDQPVPVDSAVIPLVDGMRTERLNLFTEKNLTQLIPFAAVREQQNASALVSIYEIFLPPGSYIYPADDIFSIEGGLEPSTTPEEVSSVATHTPTTGAVAGGVIAAVAFMLVVVIAILLARRRSDRISSKSLKREDEFARPRVKASVREIVYVQELGEGSSGSVMLATYNGEFVAVKKLRSKASTDVDELQQLLSEAELMASVKKVENVVKFIGIVQEETAPALIMEFCPRGSLANHLKKQRVSEFDIFKFAFGISNGMTNLVLAGVVHRDLACRNVLLSEHMHAKVSDFGLALPLSRMTTGSVGDDGDSFGPIKWQAPEVLRDGFYSEKSDVWAYGCCLIEMVTAQEPYHNFDSSIIKLMEIIKISSYSPLEHIKAVGQDFDVIPEWMAPVLRSCFHANPENRPQFREIRYLLGKAKREWKDRIENEIDEIESVLSAPGAYNSKSNVESTLWTPSHPTVETASIGGDTVAFASPSLAGMATQIDLRKIERLTKLGSGSFGSVYLGQSHGIYVALKVLDSDGYEAEVKREAEVMLAIKPHRNIVQIYGLVSQQKSLSIVMEFAPRGSLDSYVLAHYAAAKNGRIGDGQLFRWALGIARGMASLASSNVIHRDLAMRNILLDSSLEPKVSDFGLARTVLDPSQESRTKTDIGPIRWFAPECYAFKYSEKSDVWAYGCTLVEILTGELPFASLKLLQVATAVKDEGMNPLDAVTNLAEFPSWIAELMRRCFASDPANRPKFSDIVSYLEDAGTHIEEVQQVEAEIQKRRNRRADTLRSKEGPALSNIKKNRL